MKVTREGLGYRADIMAEGISMSADRLTESQGYTWAELTVERAPEGHLMRSRVKLNDEQERSQVALYLERHRKSNSVDWTGILETFFLEVLRREREGESVVTIGNLPRETHVDYLLEPMLVRGTPTILYGAEGTGKSTLAAAIAVSVATGTPCLAGWHVPTPGRVLVLDWEGNVDAWNGLIAACAYGADIAPPDVMYRPMAAALTTDLHTIARVVSENDIALVIIDSVGLASPSAREGTDANDAALRLFSAIRHLRITSLLIDHVSKTDTSGSDSRPYGSVYKPALARATYEVRAGEDADADGTRHLGLFHRKDNLTGRKPPLGIAVRRDAAIVMLAPEPLRLDDTRLAKGATLKDRLTDVLREGALDIEALATILDAAPDTLRRTLNRYRDRFTVVEHVPGGAARWGLLVKVGQVGQLSRDTSHQGRPGGWDTPPTGGVSSTTVPGAVPAAATEGRWDGLKALSPAVLAESDGAPTPVPASPTPAADPAPETPPPVAPDPATRDAEPEEWRFDQ